MLPAHAIICSASCSLVYSRDVLLTTPPPPRQRHLSSTAWCLLLSRRQTTPCGSESSSACTCASCTVTEWPVESEGICVCHTLGRNTGIRFASIEGRMTQGNKQQDNNRTNQMSTNHMCKTMPHDCLCSGGEGRQGLRFWEFG